VNVSILIPWRASGCRERDQALTFCVERWQALMPDAEVVLEDAGGEPFDRGASCNAAAARATGDMFLVADADTVVNQDQIDAALELVAATPRSWVVCYGHDRYYGLRADPTEQLLRSPVDVRLTQPDDPTDWERQLISTCGMLLVPREAFELIGGYPPGFVGWAYEDDAFRDALDTLWAPFSRVDGFCLHLWHPRGDADFEHPNAKANAALYEEFQAARGAPARMRALLGR
jgi:hypothetical protein